MRVLPAAPFLKGIMNSTNETRMRLLSVLSRSPLWAVTPKGFAELVAEINAGTFFHSKAFAQLKPTTLGERRANKVTVIPIQGVLTKDCSWCGTTYGSIADAAEEAVADPSVKRVVLAVDSPGGEVTGLPETAEVLRRVARVKPVHAVVEGTSASAAYWLTSQATDITLAPSAEVGSIGVRVMHADMSKMLSDAGIKVTELSAGQYKTEWSPFTPLTDEAKADMQQRLDTVHGNSLKDIGAGRGTRAGARIRANRFGEGRMFSAKDALSNGMVDAVQAPRTFYREIASTQTPEKTVTLEHYRTRLEVERARI
jgi:capsid assembly protease